MRRAVAGLAVVVVAGAGCGGSSSSRKTTAAPVQTTADVTTKATTRSVPHATVVRTYAATAGRRPAVRVSVRVSGYCLSGSAVVARGGAWRCTVGSQIRDPCFQAGARAVLCPLGGPWGSSALMIRLTRPLARGRAGVAGGASKSLPWALELADGARCLLLGDVAGSAGVRRLTYACDTEVELFGAPDRRHRVWTISGGSGTGPVARARAIRVAWY